MMQLEIGGLRYPIAAGEMVVGSDADCALPLSGEGVQARHAVVQGLADGSAAIRRGSPDADILVNGVHQGDEPTPVLHGDKIRIGPHELLVVDPSRAGHTKFFDSSAFEKFTPSSGSKPAAPAVVTGGRLVCLTDGREYQVGAALVIGRDASCDVVVPGNEVSRRHAQIVATEQGFVLVDTSTNGTFVNGHRVEGSRVLHRADVIRVGADEFRFYGEPTPGTGVSSSRGNARDRPGRPRSPAPGAQHRLFDTMFGGPPAAPPNRSSARARHSYHERRRPHCVAPGAERQLKGKRLTVRNPVVNIGRGDYNDLVIPEPSVSASHAKLAAARRDLGADRSGLDQRNVRGWRAAHRGDPARARRHHPLR